MNIGFLSASGTKLVAWIVPWGKTFSHFPNAKVAMQVVPCCGPYVGVYINAAVLLHVYKRPYMHICSDHQLGACLSSL